MDGAVTLHGRTARNVCKMGALLSPSLVATTPKGSLGYGRVIFKPGAQKGGGGD